MSESAVSCVIQSLEKLQSSETKFSHSICEQLNRINLKLKQLQAISKVADARQHEDDWFHEWVLKTREVSYDAQDLLDNFAIDISSRNERSILRRPSEKKLKTLHDIESKISLQEIAWQVGNTGSLTQGEILSSISQRRRQVRRSITTPEEGFVGMDEDIDKLVSQLVNEDVGSCCHVVSVVGRSGIGKTTLARRIYHHGDIRDQFDAFAWAVISRQWQTEEVLQRVLFELVPGKREQIGIGKNIAQLIKELFEAQKTKKCLVVLDDVCGTDVWDSLRPAFPNRKSGSKILITTREKEIGRHIDTDTVCYLYEQRLLDDKESLELLQKAFPLLNFSVINSHGSGSGSEHEDDTSSVGSFRSCQSIEEEDEFMGNLETTLSPHFEDPRIDMDELGKEMVGQCGGLPLAIILLGRILTSKSSLSEWEALHQSFKSHLRERCAEETARVYELLALGYHDLPYQIKQCFWYLGNFPKYFKIPLRKLYQLWAAEGLILPNNRTSEDDESIMDIAESYLRELEKRFMVQVQLESMGSRLKFCQLHELVREICIMKGKEENFRKVIPFLPDSEVNVSSPSASEATSTSSSASQALLNQMDSYFEINLTSEEDIEHVRSALFFSRLTERRNLRDTLKFLCDNFKMLRVLDLERFDFGEDLCESIGNLVHLRFLSFRGSRFNKLPSSIGNLRFLETLDLRVTFGAFLSVPDVLWKLSYLKYLYLPPSQNNTNKLQLNTLKSLEILKNFDPRISDFRDISRLNKLRKLSVIFCVEMEHLKAINKYLRISTSRITDSSFRIHYNFKSARELILLDQLVGCVHLQKLDLVGQVEKLPEHYNFSQKLNKLTLRNSYLKEDPLAILEKLPNLYSLTLRRNAYVGRRVCCSSRGFGQLRSIEMQGLSFLENWIIEEGSMPNLLQLKLDSCLKLAMLPDGIKFLSTVTEIVVANMPEAFKQTVQSLQQVGASNVVNKVIYTDADHSSATESEHPQGCRLLDVCQVSNAYLLCPQDLHTVRDTGSRLTCTLYLLIFKL